MLIATVLDCEEFHLIPDDFEWRPATAKGQVAHRAIQLTLSWRGEPNPTDLVDEAMARLTDEERGIGAWIAALSPADEADLRGQSVERVTKFMESFPPLDKRSNPMTESATRWPNEGPIILQGKVDLMIGRPAGNESRKVIIDLKTGRPSVRHRQDLGFYALVETLARSVPPRKLATFYLDAAEVQVEDVSERLLRTAVRRTLDGINAIVELQAEGRPPVRRAGVTCRWCPLAESCDEGQAFLEPLAPTTDGPGARAPVWLAPTPSPATISPPPLSPLLSPLPSPLPPPPSPRLRVSDLAVRRRSPVIPMDERCPRGLSSFGLRRSHCAITERSARRSRACLARPGTSRHVAPVVCSAGPDTPEQRIGRRASPPSASGRITVLAPVLAAPPPVGRAPPRRRDPVDVILGRRPRVSLEERDHPTSRATRPPTPNAPHMPVRHEDGVRCTNNPDARTLIGCSDAVDLSGVHDALGHAASTACKPGEPSRPSK